MHMNAFQRWVLRIIFRRLTVQGYHLRNTREVFELMRGAWLDSFPESNDPTIDLTLADLLAATRPGQDHRRHGLEDQA